MSGITPGRAIMAEDEQIRATRPKYNVVVTDAPKFDLQQYISNYTGRTVFRRLYLIASCSTVLQQEATRLAILEAKRSKDVTNYADAISLLTSIPASQDTQKLTDQKWQGEQEKQNASESKKLEAELKTYKNNLIRESIRMASEELGQHYHDIGDLGSALKHYNRMRDYCTTPAHIAAVAFHTAAVNIEQKNWLGVSAQVSRIRNLQMKQEDAAKNQPKVHAIQGLQYMALGEYREAANAFLNVEITLGDTYNEVLSSNDVAVYGGLCALASMSRSELKTRVLESTNFRSFLELEPHIRRAINSFCASKYSQCLEILELYRADYLLDIYLQEQIPQLYQKIRTKSIVQYFAPFSRVTLDSMEKMFGNNVTSNSGKTSAGTGDQNTISATTNKETFRAELIQMIQSHALSARIDLENEVLIAHEESRREQMQQDALNTVDEFIKEARIKLLRLNAVNGALEVKPVAKNAGKGGASVGGSSGGMTIEGLVDTGMGGMSGGGGGNFGGQGYSLRSGR